jgi:Outer membrane protein beta-barrel family/CarboxypepD_reg-like domain
MKSFLGKKEGKKCILLIFAFATSLSLLQGQGQLKLYIKGQLKEQKSMQPVAYATVALRRLSDSTLITGTSSNPDGEFDIESVPSGKYCLIISSIEFERVIKNIDLTKDYNTGNIFLQEKSLTLSEIVVVGERMKAKASPDKTTYFMNEKLYDASDNSVDVLKYIPGVQVDLMKNISLEGSQHIIIMVDGKERDRNFLSQLNASQIDKVEVNSTPDSRYDAGVTGVINIILKKDKEPGINGHVHIDVPTSKSVIYSFPDYSFNYSFNKLNLYTSYNGEFSYFDIVESSDRSFQNDLGAKEIISDQVVCQKDWSHRFHYGFDYLLNKKNQINFYAFYNPYSNELNGNVEMKVTGEEVNEQQWSAHKQDADINRSAFYSLYYKHTFDKPGREIAFDLSYFNFKAENSTTYTPRNITPDNYMVNQVNSVKPVQNSASFKIDYTSPITEKLKFEAGIKAKSQLLRDRQSDEFKYDESIFALYGTITYTFSKYTLSTGLRAEKSSSGLTNGFKNIVFALLPNATINCKLTPKQNIKLSYNRTVNRPNIYELNPNITQDDPYTIESGNPDLKPEFRQNLSLDYSNTIGNNFISLQLFYKERTGAINHYTFINDTGIFESRIANLGDIHEYGIQMAGALKLHKAFAISPYFKLFNVHTIGNNLAKQFDINNRQRIAFESGLSAIVTFKHDIVASFQFQYSSPEINIQGLSFSDALYFISLEKTFNQKFKVGITSAIPFSKSFIYQGTEIKSADFYSRSVGDLRLSAVPVWIKFTYQFNSGKAVHKINSNKEDLDNMPKKGF